MSWITPIVWLFGLGAIAALVAAHMISRKQPPPEPLPTARFVPERGRRVSSRRLSLSDLVLMSLRALAVVAIVAAFAGPVSCRAKGPVSRVVVVDRSRHVADMREVRDSVRPLAATAQAIIVFDSATHVLRNAQELDSTNATAAPGRLSAALAAALRAGAELALESDSVELVIVSPLVAGEIDDATFALRTGWPGRIRLVRVTERSTAAAPSAIDVAGAGNVDDPIVAAVALATLRPSAPVRLRRAEPNAADSAWARIAGHVLVHWPADSANGWRARTAVDSIGAVVAGEAVVAAPFARRWTLDGRAVARWADGEIAAVERAIGEGCWRDVAIPVDPLSDVSLRPEFRRLLSVLTAPCGSAKEGHGGFATAPGVSAAASDDSTMRMLEGAGALAPASPLRSARAERSRLTPWLFGLALVLLGVEWWARRGRIAV